MGVSKVRTSRSPGVHAPGFSFYGTILAGKMTRITKSRTLGVLFFVWFVALAVFVAYNRLDSIHPLFLVGLGIAVLRSCWKKTE